MIHYALFRLIQGKKDTQFIEALRKFKHDKSFDNQLYKQRSNYKVKFGC